MRGRSSGSFNSDWPTRSRPHFWSERSQEGDVVDIDWDGKAFVFNPVKTANPLGTKPSGALDRRRTLFPVQSFPLRGLGAGGLTFPGEPLGLVVTRLRFALPLIDIDPLGNRVERNGLARQDPCGPRCRGRACASR